MFTIAILLVSLCLCIVINNADKISRGITENEVKSTLKAVLAALKTTQDNPFYYDQTFAEEGKRMLPFAKSVINSLAPQGGSEGVIKKGVPIGAILSISGNGGGVLELMRQLEEDGYTNIKIAIVVNPKGDQNPEKLSYYKSCLKIIAAFKTNEIYRIVKPMTVTASQGSSTPVAKAQVQKDSIMSLSTKSPDEVVKFMEDRLFLGDGLCGSGYNATTDKASVPGPELVDALFIFAALSPLNGSQVYVMSHTTPSGRNEVATWEDTGHEFKCSCVVSTTYPMTAVQKDSKDGIKNILPQSPESLFLKHLKTIATDIATEVNDLEAKFAADPTCMWLEITA